MNSLLEIFNSFLLVAAAEMGDKTQLLALVLALRFRKPWVVMAGILVATVLNHLLAASVGRWVSQAVPETWLHWGLGAIFIAFGLWILIPDKDDSPEELGKYGAFLTTLVTFFFAEMGDKTQLATVALAARYDSIVLVTIGSTAGMMLADGIAVVFGERLTRKISMRWVRVASSVIFILFGLAVWFRF